MLCQQCGKNEANCMFTVRSSAGRTEIFLCSECAARLQAEYNAQSPFATSPSRQNSAASAPQKTKTAEKTILDEFGQDLTSRAESGNLDPVIGRDTETTRVIQILSRRTKNNPVLIGPAGVGKTAVAEGLAARIHAANVPENLRGKRIISLDISKILSGTKYRGDFEERIQKIIDTIQKNPDIILFIDEIHTLIGAGAADGALDAANILKPALSRGEIQIIGATTLEEYRKYIEKDSALERRFQTVLVDEPTEEQTLQILLGLRPKYEDFHKLKITDEAARAAVNLSARYISDRFLPDKAIDLIDEAAARVKTASTSHNTAREATLKRLSALESEKNDAVKFQDYERAAVLHNLEAQVRDELNKSDCNHEKSQLSVSVEDVAAVVSAWSGIPLSAITADESLRLLNLEKTLHERIIGQDDAVHAVARAIRRGRTGLKDPKRPVGSFLFLGPTGVGKTELCKALAHAIFGSEDAMIRVDMSELMERHSISKLIGSPPGYVGYDEGGQLTEKVRRKPYSIILLDEIEKAHPDVFGILLQVMEDGILTDAQGRRTDFRNTIIVMTSNVGAQNITERGIKLGFTSDSDSQKSESERISLAVTADLSKTFRPEFINRIDDVIIFHRLEPAHIKQIAENMLRHLQRRLSKLSSHLDVTDDALLLLADRGFDKLYGARPLRRLISTVIEDPIAEKMLASHTTENHFLVTALNGEIVVTDLKSARNSA